MDHLNVPPSFNWTNQVIMKTRLMKENNKFQRGNMFLLLYLENYKTAFNFYELSYHHNKTSSWKKRETKNNQILPGDMGGRMRLFTSSLFIKSVNLQGTFKSLPDLVSCHSSHETKSHCWNNLTISLQSFLILLAENILHQVEFLMVKVFKCWRSLQISPL